MCLANIDKRMKISIHALREEGDRDLYRFIADFRVISIHALREEGDKELYLTGTSTDISIHALREEGDPTSAPFERCRTNFYPRPPRGGRQIKIGCKKCTVFLFLSTPSARRATTP